MEKQIKEIGFDRYLSRLDVWAIAFGCIVGWGAFVMPGTTFLPLAGPMGTIIAYFFIVAMTANAFKEDEEAAIASGMQAHIAKPIDLEKMKETLAEILTR